MANGDEIHQNSNSPARTYFFWLLGLLVAGLSLSAFWRLLGYRYSPETYLSDPIAVGNVELTWFSVASAATIASLVFFWRRTESCRRFLKSALPLAAVSAFVVGKGLLGVESQCYDAILFSAGCGFTALWAARGVGKQLLAGGSIGDEKDLQIHLAGRALPIRSPFIFAALLWVVGLGLGVYYVWQQVGYLNNLALGYSDVGENTQLLYNTFRNPGELFLRVNPNKPMFYDHFQPGILLFAPFWLLWPEVELLIVFQVVATLIVALPLYWIGRDFFRDKTLGLLLAVCWWVYPSTSQFIYNASYGFHWGTFCLPLYFFALAFWLEGRNGWALAAAIGALLMKEEAAIVLGMFGAYLALFGGRKWAGVTMAVVGLGFFLLITGVVLPILNGHGYQQQGYFGDLGSSKWGIFLSPLTKPKVFWHKIFEPTTFYFAATLLGPLLFLPLRKPSVLFIGSLTFLFVCLWNNPMAKSICYQYQAGLLPVLFFALVRALPKDSPELGVRRRRGTLRGVIVAGVTLSVFFGNTFWSKETLSIQTSPGRLALVKRIGAKIDSNSTLVATLRLAAHFIHQKYLYVAPQLPPRTNYVFIDLRDRWRPVSGTDWLGELRSFQRQVEARPDLYLVEAEDGLLLYARQGVPLDARGMVERDSLPADVIRAETILASGIKTVGFAVASSPVERRDRLARVHINTFSTVVAPAQADLAVRCIVQVHSGPLAGDTYASDFQPLGQGIWPIERWLPGKFYMDEFRLRVPEDFSGQRLVVRLEVKVITSSLEVFGRARTNKLIQP